MTATDTTTPTTPDAAPVDPWAFLETAIESTDLTTVKAPTPLSDIPLPVRAMAERALTEGAVLKVRFPDEKMAKDCVKFLKAYALVRTATATCYPVIGGKKSEKAVEHTGPVTVRVTPQADKKVLHLTVKVPFTPTPKPLTPAQIAEKATAATAPGTETAPVVPEVPVTAPKAPATAPTGKGRK